MQPPGQRAWIPWATAGFLFILCAALAILQNRWLTQLSETENARIHKDLQERLETLRRQFNGTLDTAAANFLAYPTAAPDPVFRRAAVARADARGDITLSSGIPWPPEWDSMHEELVGRLRGRPGGRPHPGNPALVEVPIFRPPPGTPIDQWLVLELDLDYLRAHTFPDLLSRNLTTPLGIELEAEVTDGRGHFPIYRTSTTLLPRTPDAAVPLLDLNLSRPRGPGGPPGRWMLLVRYKSDSLERSLVRARWENLGLSAGLLLLIVATGILLVRSSRRAQALADLQFQFVAGVSHELRTPLSVIRSAAYNLRAKIVTTPDQIDRYSAIIQSETARISAMVEQVLLFASARSGTLVRRVAGVAVAALIEHALANAQEELSGIDVEANIQPGLPPIEADSAALEHGLRNLISNAAKYGTRENKWIGISATSDATHISVRVSDCGPGISPEDRKRLFQPFFRGQQAQNLPGTGLGLSLVRYIVEAHEGAVTCESSPQGASFTVRLPIRQHAANSPR